MGIVDGCTNFTRLMPLKAVFKSSDQELIYIMLNKYRSK